MCLEFLTKKFL